MKELDEKEYYEIDFIKQQIKACEIAEKLQKEPKAYREVKMLAPVEENARKYISIITTSSEVSYMPWTRKDYYRSEMSSRII